MFGPQCPYPTTATRTTRCASWSARKWNRLSAAGVAAPSGTAGTGAASLPFILSLVFRGEDPEESRRVARDDAVRRHVARHDAAGGDDGVLADDDLGQDGCAGPDRRAFPDERGFDGPVSRRLKLSRLRRRSRIRVVDERDAVSDEDLVLDSHAFTDEGVARDLAASTDGGILLDFDEGSNFGFVADFAAVQIDEGSQLDVFAQLHVGRDAQMFVDSHRVNRRPCRR